MFIALPQLKGTLDAAILAGTTSLTVSATLLGVVQKYIDGIAWTYAGIRSGSTYEVVRVVGYTDTQILVQRGIDGTTPAAFPSGATLEYILGNTALDDIILNKQLASVTLEVEGALEIESSAPGAYTLFYPVVALSGAGRIGVVGTYATGYTVYSSIPIGCCGYY